MLSSLDYHKTDVVSKLTLLSFNIFARIVEGLPGVAGGRGHVENEN